MANNSLQSGFRDLNSITKIKNNIIAFFYLFFNGYLLGATKTTLKCDFIWEN